MLKLGAILGIVVAIFVGLFMVSSGENADKESAFSAIQSAMSDGSSLIDVREVDEYSESYIQGAINLPLSQLQTGSPVDLDKSKTHYVYCRSGNRSAEAADLLRQAGYSVVDLGGIDSVAQSGGKLCSQSC